ncbi:class I SAM-dependent methyltransferase [Brevibacillus reuszeri]|uniref:class I SAM-dependent methyltransferase n=1 Tax=Brevibacillus reuszeri TaxID=54915 RepID=UPI00289E9E96|nr:class I SAM-dependent methyltransferase [Brevibacillus reuszeri]
MQKKDEIKQAVQQQFGKNAENYVHSKNHAKGSDLELLVEWLHPKKDWTVLDIATGGGHVARTLAPHVDIVIAADLTREMLEAASRANREAKAENIIYVQADAEALPFLDESVDVVTCRIAAHHFPDPKAFVHEVSRVLRPGGAFLFIDNVAPEDSDLASFVNRVEKMRDPSHVRCLSINEWRALHVSNGLTESKQRQRKKKFEFVPWVKRLSESLAQEEAIEQYLLAATEEQQAYLEMKIEHGKVLTHQIDEWMVLCYKTGGQSNGK